MSGATVPWRDEDPVRSTTRPHPGKELRRGYSQAVHSSALRMYMKLYAHALEMPVRKFWSVEKGI